MRNCAEAIATVGRRIPLKSGLARISNHRWIRAMMSGAGVQTARLRNGMTVRVDLGDYNGRLIKCFGTIDPQVVAVCQACLLPGDCFLDIGANYGVVGLLCARAVGPDGSIHFIEPQPRLCKWIAEAIKASGLQNAIVHQIGLLDRDGWMGLVMGTDHTGAASLVRSAGDGGNALLVRVRSARPFVQEVGSGRRIVAKIDVEGAESVVLPAVLEHQLFGAAVFECNSAEDRHTAWSAVCSRGHRLFGLTRALLSVELERIDQPAQMKSHHDFVVLPRSRTTRTGRRFGLSTLERLARESSLTEFRRNRSNVTGRDYMPA